MPMQWFNTGDIRAIYSGDPPEFDSYIPETTAINSTAYYELVEDPENPGEFGDQIDHYEYTWTTASRPLNVTVTASPSGVNVSGPNVSGMGTYAIEYMMPDRSVHSATAFAQIPPEGKLLSVEPLFTDPMQSILQVRVYGRHFPYSGAVIQLSTDTVIISADRNFTAVKDAIEGQLAGSTASGGQPATAQGDRSSGHAGYPPTAANAALATKVRINGKLAVVVGSQFIAHTQPNSGPHIDAVATPASSKVRVEGKGLARLGDAIVQGGCVAEGSSNVFAGG